MIKKVKEALRVSELRKSFIEEGKEVGAKIKAIEVTKRAILKGMDNETIKDLTDLTIEEIETIRNTM